MTVQQQKAIGIGATVAVAALAGAYYFGVSPQLEARGENQQATQVAEQETGMLSTRLADLEAKRDNLGQAEKEFAEIAAQFPHSYEQPDWLELVYAAAEKSDVAVTAINPGVPLDPAFIDPVTGQAIPGSAESEGEFPIAVSVVQVAATGTPEDLSAFVESMENLKRPLLISDLEVSGSDEMAGLTVDGSVFLTRPMERPGSEQADDVEGEPSA